MSALPQLNAEWWGLKRFVSVTSVYTNIERGVIVRDVNLLSTVHTFCLPVPNIEIFPNRNLQLIVNSNYQVHGEHLESLNILAIKITKPARLIGVEITKAHDLLLRSFLL